MTRHEGPLDYATPQSLSPADSRRVFIALLPVGIFVGVFLGSAMFEDGDSRNLGGACCMLLMVPIGLIGLGIAITEARRPGGLRAVANGLIGAALVAGGLCGALWVILRFRLFRH